MCYSRWAQRYTAISMTKCTLFGECKPVIVERSRTTRGIEKMHRLLFIATLILFASPSFAQSHFQFDMPCPGEGLLFQVTPTVPVAGGQFEITVGQSGYRALGAIAGPITDVPSTLRGPNEIDVEFSGVTAEARTCSRSTLVIPIAGTYT